MTARNSHTYDNLLLLKDAAAVTASGAASVGGSPRVLDVGLGRINALAQIDTSALDATTGDETYMVAIQGSTVLNFATFVELGEVSVAATGRNEAHFTNQQGDTIYRYIRAYHTLAGTTPSINYTAFLAKQ
jgi:hypothetical protein